MRADPFVSVVMGLAVVAMPWPALAYLDPGTGSMILQVVLGGVAGAVVVGKLYWHRLLSLFGVHPEEAEASAGKKDAGAEPKAR